MKGVSNGLVTFGNRNFLQADEIRKDFAKFLHPFFRILSNQTFFLLLFFFLTLSF
jgi:hypothetical protein